MASSYKTWRKERLTDIAANGSSYKTWRKERLTDIAANGSSYKWPAHTERFEGRPSRFPDCVRPQDERLIPQ